MGRGRAMGAGMGDGIGGDMRRPPGAGGGRSRRQAELGPQVLIDEDREIAGRWVGGKPPQPVLFVISTDNVVQLIVTGEPSEASRRQLAAAIGALQPVDGGD